MKTLLALLLLLPSAASAENWVDIKYKSAIDVDNIKKDKDGLTYYLIKHKVDVEQIKSGWTAPSKAAMDCQKRVSYSAYYYGKPGWREKGTAVIPGTYGEYMLDFVCTRVK